MMTDDPMIEAVALDAGTHTARSYGASAIEAALFRTRSGAVVKLLCGFAVEREPAFHFLSLYGSDGSIETDRYRPYEGLKAHFADVPNSGGLIEIPVSHHRPGARAVVAGGHGTSEYDMVDRFVSRIRGRAESGETPAKRDGPAGTVDRSAPMLGIDEALNMSVPGICAHLSALRGSTPVAVPVYGEDT